MELSDRSRLARRLASALEPVVGQVYFSPECHSGYVALGFAESPGNANGVALPDGPSYFASRGSVMGQVPGEVIAAAFGVFSPAIVVPLVDEAWQRTDAATIRDARAEGAVGPTAPVARRRAGRCRARRGVARDGSGRAPDLGTPAGRRHPVARRARRPARRDLAPRRFPARVPRRFTQRGVGVGRPHRHADRSADGVVLEPSDAQLQPVARVDGAGVRRRRSGAARPWTARRRRLVRRGSPGARRDRGRHRRPDGARARRPGRRRTRGVRDPRTMGCAACGRVSATCRTDRTISPHAEPCHRRSIRADSTR